MDIWVPGLLSLIGALIGVGLANYLGTRTKRREDADRRLGEAIKAVALARAAAQFSYRAGVAGVPPSIREADHEQLERTLWLSGLERYFVRLREAREAVAALAIDGVDLTSYCESDTEMQAALEVVWKELHQRAGRAVATLDG